MLIVGCSGEPSEADISKAVAATYKDWGLADKDTSFKAEKLGCEKEGKAYSCDVSMTINTKLGEQKQTARARFIRTADGWAMTR